MHDRRIDSVIQAFYRTYSYSQPYPYRDLCPDVAHSIIQEAANFLIEQCGKLDLCRLARVLSRKLGATIPYVLDVLLLCDDDDGSSGGGGGALVPVPADHTSLPCSCSQGDCPWYTTAKTHCSSSSSSSSSSPPPPTFELHLLADVATSAAAYDNDTHNDDNINEPPSISR